MKKILFGERKLNCWMDNFPTQTPRMRIYTHTYMNKFNKSISRYFALSD